MLRSTQKLLHSMRQNKNNLEIGVQKLFYSQYEKMKFKNKKCCLNTWPKLSISDTETTFCSKNKVVGVYKRLVLEVCTKKCSPAYIRTAAVIKDVKKRINSVPWCITQIVSKKHFAAVLLPWAGWQWTRWRYVFIRPDVSISKRCCIKLYYLREVSLMFMETNLKKIVIGDPAQGNTNPLIQKIEWFLHCCRIFSFPSFLSLLGRAAAGLKVCSRKTSIASFPSALIIPSFFYIQWKSEMKRC